MATNAQSHFKKPAGQDAYYPPESESPRRLLEKAEVTKHLPRCTECNYILNSREECINLECVQSVVCPACYGPKELGARFCSKDLTSH